MKNLLVISMLFLLPQLLLSQDCCDKWSFGADFNLAVPLQDLKTNGFGNNYGASFDLIYHGGQFSGIRFQPGFRLNGGVSSGNSENFTIDLPGNPIGESTISNTMGDFKILGRIVTDQNKRFKAYMEGFIGIRISGSQRRIQLVENSYGDSSFDRLNTRVSEVIGIGGGILIGLSDIVDLNLRAGVEHSSVMGHYDVVSDPYPLEAVRTNKAINASFGLGVLIRINDCDDDDDQGRRRDYDSDSRIDYTPKKKYKIKKEPTKTSKS